MEITMAYTSSKISAKRLSKKQRIQNWRTKEAARTKAKQVQAAAGGYKSSTSRP
jgi:hypothetical protein